MLKRDIRTTQEEVVCDVCGRSLLRGERAEPYLAAGTRRHVCELCTARAVHEGWIREEASSGELPARRPRHDGRRSLIGRLRGRREASANGGSGSEEAPSAAPADVAVPEGPREPRHVHAVPTNDDLKVTRALELFNASDHPRTVAGVARSLGAPFGSVRPLEHEPSVVSIVVAWELSWYRFEVDLSDEAGGVRLAEQGSELGALSEADRRWNAGADEAGALQLVGAPA